MRTFQVPYNFLFGTLPLSIARLGALNTLDVTCNAMSGLMPALPFQQYVGFCGFSDHHCTDPFPTNKWKCPLPAGAATYCPATLCSK